MTERATKGPGCGCWSVIAAVIVVLVIIGFFEDEFYEPRDYIAPASSQEDVGAFAKARLNALQDKSFADGVEYCGMIYEDKGGKLSTTEVFRGDDASCDFEFEWGGDLNPVASYHTHGDHDLDFDNEAPSLIDMNEDIKNQVDGYIATPGGRLWRIDWREERAELVCGPGCLKQDPDYRPCPAYPVKEQYTLETLEERIENDPDRC